MIKTWYLFHAKPFRHAEVEEFKFINFFYEYMGNRCKWLCSEVYDHNLLFFYIGNDHLLFISHRK